MLRQNFLYWHSSNNASKGFYVCVPYVLIYLYIPEKYIDTVLVLQREHKVFVVNYSSWSEFSIGVITYKRSIWTVSPAFEDFTLFIGNIDF